MRLKEIIDACQRDADNDDPESSMQQKLIDWAKQANDCLIILEALGRTKGTSVEEQVTKLTDTEVTL